MGYVKRIVMEWISVKDRLPDNSRTVLVSGGCAYYLDGNWYSRMDEGDPIIEWIVGYWMELPKPPNDEK